ncbi:nuclear transport factor 2 family protein [Emticicia sp. W12TSBA100-4]|uniref:nuclear transport factor 2 family protein n=1 Tax=Emticicia sp. W12TSBA100-4 TaxID=3160965 RepID=UPI00330581C7
MKKLIISTLCFLAAIQFSFAQSNIEQLLSKLEEEYRQNPAAAFKKYADDNFLFINAEGGSWDKNRTIKSVSSAKLEDVSFTEKTFKTFGNITIVNGINKSRWNFGKVTINYKDAFTYIYQINGNDVKWLSSQHSLVTPKDRNKAIYRELNNLSRERKIDYTKFYAETHEIKGIGKGPKAVEAYNNAFIKAFPDLQITVVELIAEGDLVFARCEATGTQKGELNGIKPTEKTAKVAHWTVNRFNAEGKITESWNLNDTFSMMQQLGINK